MFARWRDGRRTDARRHLAADEAVRLRAARRWGSQGEQWQEWLRRSPLGLDLFARWREAGDYLHLLGDDAYRRQMVELLSRAAPRDCAAAGFGCTRRNDRACRAPEICSRDPGPGAPVPGVPGSGMPSTGPAGIGPAGGRREGPVPGACDAFYGYHGDDLRIQISFAAGDRHRAVFWAGNRGPGRLWVDGLPVGAHHLLAAPGYWVGDRFFVADAQGPDDHPAQRYVLSDLATAIVALLIHDAEQAATHLLVPRPDELWTDPSVELRGDLLHVYPDLAARRAGRPDRTLPAT